jgi:DNA polymerase-3 subunit alpha
MITKLIPFGWRITLKEVFAEMPKLRELEQKPKYAELFALVRKLENLRCHSTTHGCGMVIGKTALYNIVPIYKAPGIDSAVTQYDMDHLGSSGLIRYDFLALEKLDHIKYTEELIRNRGGEYADFSIENISEDDEAAFTLFGEGKTEYVFQFESEGMMDILKQIKPKTIQDLMALNALYRPGAFEYISQFMEAKNGTEKINYPDPCLEDILRETYGIIVYQEQVMRIVQRITGFSLAKADLVRRIMMKKDRKQLDKEKENFIFAARANGFTENKAAELFDILLHFTRFSFIKSHNAAYIKIAYQTAYLKANFPAEFTTAFCSYQNLKL